MKSNLILKKFKVTPEYGTKNLIHKKSFFGSNLMNIENVIFIDDSSISYKDYQNVNNFNMIGYQFGDNNTQSSTEIETSISYSDIKLTNHVVNIYNQSVESLQRNTQWEFIINTKNILIKYLFYNIKKNRIFKCVKYNELINKDINISIINFINNNLINNYIFYNIDFYVKYYDLTTNKVFYNNTLLQLNPLYDVNIYDQQYKISNYTILKNDDFKNFDDIKIIYN